MGAIGKTFSTMHKYSEPFTSSIGIITVASGIYVRAVVCTYGPSKVADICIWGTIRAVNNTVAGKVLGATVIAPAVVPHVMPYISLGLGILGAFFVMVACNIIAHIIFGMRGPHVFVSKGDANSIKQPAAQT